MFSYNETSRGIVLSARFLLLAVCVMIVWCLAILMTLEISKISLTGWLRNLKHRRGAHGR